MSPGSNVENRIPVVATAGAAVLVYAIGDVLSALRYDGWVPDRHDLGGSRTRRRGAIERRTPKPTGRRAARGLIDSASCGSR